MGEERGERFLAAWTEWMGGGGGAANAARGTLQVGLDAATVLHMQQHRQEQHLQQQKEAQEYLQQEQHRRQCRQQLLEANPLLDDGSEDWLLVSFHWDYQKTILRVVRALRARGYLAWVDPEDGDGDDSALHKAVGRSEAMLYTVCQGYEDSTNCRATADHASAQGMDLIPLMMQRGFQPGNSWLGMLLGTRLWYATRNPLHLTLSPKRRTLDGVSTSVDIACESCMGLF
jgi:hypothetical protein